MHGLHGSPNSAKRPAAALSVRRLELSRGGRRLCSALTFTVGAGERLEVTGANGSGKTTLLRALAGLSEPDAGEVSWCAGPGGRLARELCYVGHKPGLKAELSARENLRFYAGLKGLGESGDVADALARFGLADAADAPCAGLSEGQRRRAALARLLVERAPLWLLDEPAATLDREGVAALEEALAAHAADGGVAVVATHQPLGAGGGVRRLELSAPAASSSYRASCPPS